MRGWICCGWRSKFGSLTWILKLDFHISKFSCVLVITNYEVKNGRVWREIVDVV